MSEDRRFISQEERNRAVADAEAVSRRDESLLNLSRRNATTERRAQVERQAAESTRRLTAAGTAPVTPDLSGTPPSNQADRGRLSDSAGNFAPPAWEP